MTEQKTEQGSLESMVDRVEIEEAAQNMGRYADRRDWEALVGLFTEEVERDYSSLTGLAPDRTTARELVGGWAEALGGLDATQHFIGPSIVGLNGDRATAEAYFQATHRLHNATGAEKWTLGGRYNWTFERTVEGWRISGVIMTALWAEGNQNVMALAAGGGQGG